LPSQRPAGSFLARCRPPTVPGASPVGAAGFRKFRTRNRNFFLRRLLTIQHRYLIIPV
jgi:hypothetical protein